ncbi:hypothetical protein ACFLSI_01380 [Bacteroidota bacterium]
MRKVFLYIIVSILVLLSCDKVSNGVKKNIIASVLNKNLYYEDIKDLIPQYNSSSDSLVFVKKYIDKWVMDQLLLNKARVNLSQDIISIQKKIDDYRTKIMILHYQQQLIKQELDSIVSDSEIEEYYETYLTDFKLTQNIVKVVYIQIPLSSNESDNVKRLIRSDDSLNQNQLKNIIIQEKGIYNNFNNNWVRFSKLLSSTPIQIPNKERFLRTDNYNEKEDSNNLYCFSVKDYRIARDSAPVSFLRNRIIDLIINKRKIAIIQNNKDDIYNRAIIQNQIEIFID